MTRQIYIIILISTARVVEEQGQKSAIYYAHLTTTYIIYIYSNKIEEHSNGDFRGTQLQYHYPRVISLCPVLALPISHFNESILDAELEPLWSRVQTAM